ncbi:FAD:protein FMN transferase [Pinibacter soli]|uniref:FAD:protein FMN transferase n=1 Tax=Pinibacter soli TaxID=3044211 RepID=A0ABT6RBG8_9BACT|nr:FAD:protein FMN transferase [Pinibacter soli]MDI3319916.1 FAD:protein FMN transferase [Pinibacter soli]
MHKIQINGFAQGTTYHITYYAEDSSIHQLQVDSILNSLDSSLSIYKPYSVISQFNASASGCNIDKHLKAVVKKSLDTYEQTNGLFDITVLPLVQAWGFGNKKNVDDPDSAVIQSLLPCISSKLLVLESNFLRKLKPCVQIDVNGIAQGYSVDVLSDFFEANGIRNYMIEVGGEIRVKGKKYPENTAMKIGIEAPQSDFDKEHFQKVISLDSGAITTSGSYGKYHESGGKKVSHIINPKTGYSSQNELISVTVFAKDAITADAYDNALMLMGLTQAIKFVDGRKDMRAYFIYEIGGAIRDTVSANFKDFNSPLRH